MRKYRTPWPNMRTLFASLALLAGCLPAAGPGFTAPAPPTQRLFIDRINLTAEDFLAASMSQVVEERRHAELYLLAGASEMKPKYATLKANCYLSNELNANYVDKKRLYGEIGDDKIAGYGGGHIDLIETVDTVQVCNSACYFSSQEVWFWPLD